MSNNTVLAETPASPATEMMRRSRNREEKRSRRSAEGTKRQAGSRTKAGSRERYFLANGSGEDGQIALGRELPSEQQVLVAAFQEQTTFYVLNEFRVEAEFKGKGAELVKKSVIKADQS